MKRGWALQRITICLKLQQKLFWEYFTIVVARKAVCGMHCP